MRRQLLLGGVAGLVLVLTVNAGAGVPEAYKRTTSTVATGIERNTYVRTQPDEVVNVARLRAGADYELRAIPGKDGFGDGLERTSSICRRTGCAVAVNGDFWRPGTDMPIGGVVSLGRLLRTPPGDHPQVSVSADGTVRTDELKLRASLVPDDLEPVAIDAINRRVRADELVLSTPAAGRTTKAKRGTLEIRLDAVRPKGPVLLSRTTIVRIAEHGSDAGDMPIPVDGAVLSGRGKGESAIRDLLARIRAQGTSRDALLRIDSNLNAVESFGGSHIIVRDGKASPPTDRTGFVAGRHPRTAIGWTAKGDVLLVTVDGRQPGYSEGMTLAELSRFLVNLGAVDALNLDGGGSTTFVKSGTVANRPSDRAVESAGRTEIVKEAEGQATLGNVERPVAMALAIVPKDPARAAAASDAMSKLPLPEPVLAAPPHASDVGSMPLAALPALIPGTAQGAPVLRLIAMVLSGFTIALVAGWAGYRHGIRRAR